MKNLTKSLIGAGVFLAVVGGFVAQHLLAPATQEQYQGYIITHHANYMVDVTELAGGTNKIFHTRSLPTEGKDNVVTPALDHIYSKAVIDLTAGTVYFTTPDVPSERYFSYHITDQEHYTVTEAYNPSGEFAIVRAGTDYRKAVARVGEANVIVSPGDYPHLFIRTQVFNTADLVNVHAIQDALTIDAPISQPVLLDVTKAPVKWVQSTHDVWEQNINSLNLVQGFSQWDYKITHVKVGIRYLTGKVELLNTNGLYNHINEGATGNHERRAVGVIGHLGFPETHAYYEPWQATCDGVQLNGDTPHTITVPHDANLDNFWSLTRYDGGTRNTYAGTNDMYNMYNTEPDANGDITVTFSSEDPQDDTYWMPVNSGDDYYFVLRYYGMREDTIKSREYNCK
jgi:hypothetical protein